MRYAHFRHLLVVVVAALMLIGFAASTSAHPVRGQKISRAATHKKAAKAVSAKALKKKIFKLRRKIDLERRATWSWQRVVLPTTTRTTYCEKSQGLAYLKWCFRLWTKRHQKWQKHVQNPPHKREWMCIHSFEAPWNGRDNATHRTYFGGLQMDREFQATYGGHLLLKKGTADHWTPLEQMWVAERAWKESGFSRWPNTARYCGLL